jgi:pyridoxamine 5'-phosphate oxidase
MELFETRKKLILKTLDVETVNENPITQLEQWLNEASLAKCPEYSVMTLATASLEGQPSTRVVLLKYLKKDGLYFFTNYDSRKGKDLLLNPYVAANFFWPELERQVRIEGQVTKADPDISDFYFRSRPFESKVSAIISPQSRDITDRSSLENEWNKIFLDWSGKELERPDYWGGFLLNPNRIEFWQGRPYRLHDRIVYKKQTDGWKIKRIAP